MNIRHSALFIEKAETEFIPSELIKGSLLSYRFLEIVLNAVGFDITTHNCIDSQSGNRFYA